MTVDVEGFENFEGLLEAATEVDPPEWWVGTAVRYGTFLEFGTIHMEPRPWLRPAMDRVAGRTSSILGEVLAAFDMEEMSVSTRTLAEQIERSAKLAMRRNSPPAPPGEAPAVRTGTLIDSVVNAETERDLLTKSISAAL